MVKGPLFILKKTTRIPDSIVRTSNTERELKTNSTGVTRENFTETKNAEKEFSLFIKIKIENRR